MTSHPLLLSTPMVLAFFAGRKTVTRRIPGPTNSLVDGRRVSGKTWRALNFAKTYGIKDNAFYFFSQTDEQHHKVEPICQPGDKLWFRETWNLLTYGDHSFYGYAADSGHPKDRKWRPSIHMPKEACRLWADCGTVTCEHLSDITEEQAEAEGVDKSFAYEIETPDGGQSYTTYRAGFKRIWEQLHGPDSFTANPPVYAINFNPITRKP